MNSLGLDSTAELNRIIFKSTSGTLKTRYNDLSEVRNRRQQEACRAIFTAIHAK